MSEKEKKNLEVMFKDPSEEIVKIAEIDNTTSMKVPSFLLTNDGIWFLLEKASLEVAKVRKV